MSRHNSVKYSICHPERKHHCKGLCEKCYNKKMRERRSQDLSYRIKSAAKTREWRKSNREKAWKLDAEKQLKKKYNITLEQYDSMFSSQNGLCYICKKPESISNSGVTQRLCVDHCHKTGKIRKLLCMRCNTSLARVEEVGIKEFERYLYEQV